MTQRSAFQIQILEKLGAPLLAAVNAAPAREASDSASAAGEKQDAEKVAALLNKAVQVSVAMSGAMGIKDADGQGDSARLALAALGGSLLAGQYRQSGKMPGDSEVKRITKALEAVLTFSDSFAPAAVNTARLENMAPGDQLRDDNQIGIQYVHALIPVVNAIAGFSFGRPENVLAQEVAGRLVQEAARLREALASDAGPADAKYAEMRILQALCQIYAACHMRETEKLLAMDDTARAKIAENAGGTLPIDPVWKDFDLRVAMMTLVAKSAAAGAGKAPAASASAVAPALDAAAPAAQSAPPEDRPAASVKTEIPEKPVPQAAEPEEAAPENFNPMGFFKPKEAPAKDDEGGAA